MNVIVDAQVVAAFYKEDVLRAEHDLTQAVSDLFARFQSEDSLFLDDDGTSSWSGATLLTMTGSTHGSVTS